MDDFKNYFHKMQTNKEEASLDPVQKAPQEVQSNGTMDSILSVYLNKSGNLKTKLVSLADDLGKAIAKYISEDFVSDDEFDSEDEKIKYLNAIRDQITEGYNKKLIEVLREVGIFAENTKIKITK